MMDDVLAEEWQILSDLLPENWRELSKTTRALRRARGVKDPDTLLRLILLHCAGGLSLRSTVARAKAQGLATITDVALMQRLKRSRLWLESLTTSMLRSRQRRIELPSLKKYRLRAIDATTVEEPGATGTSWRVHYSLTLPSLTCDFFEVTDKHGGETLKRFAIEANDLILCDRAYGHREAVAGVMEAGGQVIVRLTTGNFPLLTRRRAKFPLLGSMRSLKGHHPKSWPVLFEVEEKEQGQEKEGGKTKLLQARLCAVRKSATAAARARRKFLQEASKKQKRVGKVALELTKYVFVLTTVPEKILDATEILELYRCRWQVELAFKRLKSLLQLGHLPKYDDESARAWLQAKLLTALMIEKLAQNAELLSPWGFALSTNESLADLPRSP